MTEMLPAEPNNLLLPGRSSSVTHGLVVEPASFADLDDIMAIEHASFSAPWSREAFAAEFNGNAFSHLLVARLTTTADSRLAGYCCFWIVFEEVRILNFAVGHEHRRQGIGTQLLSDALTIGSREGATRALLEVRSSNVDAQVFYQRFGFRPYGRRTAYYTNPVEDAILMTLDPLCMERS